MAFTPSPVDPHSPFAQDGPGPALTLELSFATDATFARAAPELVFLLAEATPSSLADRPFEAQAVRGRRFPTADSAFRLEPGRFPCTLLVEYVGQCEDVPGWLDHYDAHHPAIMARFPAVRDVATYRPAPDLALPRSWRPATAMQRNKVVFDSTTALAAALASPVMAEMRTDFKAFPPFIGKPMHFPTETLDLRA
jgi:hypothetical protein